VVTGDPLRRLPAAARLWAAAGLSALPLGLSTDQTRVSQAPIRVFLVAAAIAFAVCAVGVRTEAKRALARTGCACASAGAALAAANEAPRVLLCLIGALVLVAPLVVLAKRPHAR
jgi:hypothetical protein